MAKKNDIRFTAKFAEKFILSYTKKGDNVFDPFAGFGTTLFTAQKNGRTGIGIEYDKARADYIKNKLKLPSYVVHGDCKRLNLMELPKMDFLLTSPPYMRYFDRKNPLTNYKKAGNYGNYLLEIGKIFFQIKNIMKNDSVLVVEVSNTFGKKYPMTPLAWDIGKEISKYLFLEKEIIYCNKGKTSAPNSDHSYCMIFRNKQP